MNPSNVKQQAQGTQGPKILEEHLKKMERSFLKGAKSNSSLTRGPIETSDLPDFLQ